MKDVPKTVKTSLQRWSRIIAMHVRNQMEDFHCEHLADDEMKELNPIIRNAIYEALHSLFLMRHGKNQSQRIYGAMQVNYWLMMAPDYWEPPGLADDTAKRLQQLSFHELRSMPWISSERSRKEFEEFCRDNLDVFG